MIKSFPDHSTVPAILSEIGRMLNRKQYNTFDAGVTNLQV
jgi:hypothetical protein